MAVIDTGLSGAWHCPRCKRGYVVPPVEWEQRGLCDQCAVPQHTGNPQPAMSVDDAIAANGMRWCPACNGMGEVTTMDASPDLNEHTEPCAYPGCKEGRGIVPVGLPHLDT